MKISNEYTIIMTDENSAPVLIKDGETIMEFDRLEKRWVPANDFYATRKLNETMLKTIEGKLPYFEGYSEREMVRCYATIICSVYGRRDVLDEEYILDRIDSLDKMKQLMDKFIARIPALQGEAIIEDIDVINGTNNPE